MSDGEHGDVSPDLEAVALAAAVVWLVLNRTRDMPEWVATTYLLAQERTAEWVSAP